MGKPKKKEPRHVAFIQDDNGDVARGPAESKADAKKRADDALTSSHRNIKAWTEEVK